ncbi:unnamed protein product [Staurois parvus]|uniref:Secreted protein n=1 Tax=Staurois parvus TaxID=386267 RepID=A0ABN9DMY7_9NEOB|nr:unnamed protein product [Staurois parvus]
MPLPLGVMLVIVSLAMPRGICSSATAGGQQFDTRDAIYTDPKPGGPNLLKSKGHLSDLVSGHRPQ